MMCLRSKYSLLKPLDSQGGFPWFLLIFVDFIISQPAASQQEAGQVIAFAGRFQFTEQVTDVLSKVDFVVLAIFDNWVHSLVFVPICLDNDYLQRWNYPFWQQCGEMDTYGLQATVDE